MKPVTIILLCTLLSACAGMGGAVTETSGMMSDLSSMAEDWRRPKDDGDQTGTATAGETAPAPRSQ